MPYTNKKYLGFDDFWFTIIGILILGFLIPIVFFDQRFDGSFVNILVEWLESCTFTTCYWLTSRAIMVSFRKKYPSFEMTKKRLIYAALTCILVVILIGITITPIINFLFEFFNLPDTKQPTNLEAFSATFTATFLVLAIYESIWYHSQLKKSIQEQEQVKVAHIQSQLEGLRNQVNPHFLFNSLNTLNHIVEYEEKTVAKKFINQLSTVYRYILDSREESTILLKDELAFVNAYIDIQKERFLDNLQIKIDIPKTYYYKKVIPLSLQLLIENAIKHNIISRNKPLHIIIDIDKELETIQVTNNLQKKSRILHSTKVGLENIKERYQLLAANKSVTVDISETHFKVSLPLLY